MIELSENLPCLNEEILNTLEQVWEFKLPEDYRTFLLTKNGGYPIKKFFNFKMGDDESVLQAFLGITPQKHLNLLKEMKLYRERIPSHMFPIAYDSFGNLILLSVKNPDRGKVYFWDHEREADPAQGEVPDYSNLTLIADSFDEFINNLRGEEDV